jgi:glutaredoxin
MIKVYGADWCGDTKKAISHLEDLEVDYQYINVEKDTEASEWVKNQNNGKERKPTFCIGDKILSVPTVSELDGVLKQEGYIS